MIVNLIKSNRLFQIVLPNKVNGQFWLKDIDENGNSRNVVEIEAIKGEWIAKSSKWAKIYDQNKNYLEQATLSDDLFLDVRIGEERASLFAETNDQNSLAFKKFSAIRSGSFSIGRSSSNQICFEKSFVSSQHAILYYDGQKWSIQDNNSLNGTYVNGVRIDKADLNPGDIVYIMGMRIVIGGNFFAVSASSGHLKIDSPNLMDYTASSLHVPRRKVELPERHYFSRSPKFDRETIHAVVSIDPPPAPQKIDSVPLALMLGPSLTMAMTSVGSGVLSATNVISNGGNFSQALPMLVMSASMLMGTVLWPPLTKKYEKKSKIKAEKKRQDRYLAYLNETRDKIDRIAVEQGDILRERLISCEECSSVVLNKQSMLWNRVIGQEDFLWLRLGTGNIPMDIEIKAAEKKFTMDDDSLQNAMMSIVEAPKELKSVPVGLSLLRYPVLGISGTDEQTIRMLQNIILQTVTFHSYDELKIILFSKESNGRDLNYVKYIPHFWSDDKSVRYYAVNESEANEMTVMLDRLIQERTEKGSETEQFETHYLIIATDPRIVGKNESLKDLLKKKGLIGCSLIVLGNHFDDFPKETDAIIQIDENTAKILDKANKTGKPITFTPDDIPEGIGESISSKLANIELELANQKYALPTTLTFLEMFDVGKVEHLNSLTRWKENNPSKSLQTPVGVDTYGELFKLDLHEKFHGPHGLVAGMTGSGKSEFIITYILSMAVNYHPDEVAFILIDYKGGGLAGAFEDDLRGIRLPHLAGTITNLDGASIKRSLVSIESELRRRQAVFNEARKISGEGTMDIYKYQQLYRNKAVQEPMPHLFIISDEFAELKSQQPDFMDQLISAARIGRSLGVHLILATQKPSGVVDDQIWSNSKFRVCLKVQERADSQDMIKCPNAAELTQTGRFYLQVGFNEFFALGQSAWCGADYIPMESSERIIEPSVRVIDNLGKTVIQVKSQNEKLQKGKRNKQVVEIVKYLSDLASSEKVAAKKLWLDPIPAKIYMDDLERMETTVNSRFVLNPIVGEYDDPYHQRQHVLTIPLSEEGNCLIYGSSGMGKTTFLTTLCFSLIKHHSASELNLYILDMGSETLKCFEAAPQVGGVVTGAEKEKVLNLFKMLGKEIEIRKELFSSFGGDFAGYCKDSSRAVPNIVVILNHFSGFAEQYEELLDVFASLTRDGVKYGIYFVVSANGVNEIRYKIQQNFKMMLTMQLNDPSDYAIVVGRTDGLIPEKYKGRGLIAFDRPYEFQTAYCCKDEDAQTFIRQYCSLIRQNEKTFAKPIPVLPSVVDYAFVKPYISTLSSIPFGVDKQTLEIKTINLANKVIFPVIAQDVSDCGSFAQEFIKVLTDTAQTTVLDSERVLNDSEMFDAERTIVNIFEEMVKRNNVYVDSKMDPESLKPFPEMIFAIIGVEKLFARLSADGKDKLNVLLEKAEPAYKVRFVLFETDKRLNGFNYEAWFRRHSLSDSGLWVGDGIANQYTLKIDKVTSDLYAEVQESFGYFVSKGHPKLVKLLSEKEEES